MIPETFKGTEEVRRLIQRYIDRDEPIPGDVITLYLRELQEEESDAEYWEEKYNEAMDQAEDYKREIEKLGEEIEELHDKIEELQTQIVEQGEQ